MIKEYQGIYRAIFRDNTLTLADPRVIHLPHGQINEVAEKVRVGYADNLISPPMGSDGGTYLISGCAVQINIVRIEKACDSGADQIVIKGEVKSAMRGLAKLIGLGEIPNNSFKVR